MNVWVVYVRDNRSKSHAGIQKVLSQEVLL